MMTPTQPLKCFSFYSDRTREKTHCWKRWIWVLRINVCLVASKNIINDLNLEFIAQYVKILNISSLPSVLNVASLAKPIPCDLNSLWEDFDVYFEIFMMWINQRWLWSLTRSLFLNLYIEKHQQQQPAKKQMEKMKIKKTPWKQ